MADILSELLARRGFARQMSAAAYDEAWREAAGELTAKYTRVAGLRRGALEIVVANSVLLQELSFRKDELLRALNGALHDEAIEDLRFRIGAIQN